MADLFAFQTAPFSGEVWDFTIVSGPTPEDWTKVFTYWKDVKFTAMSDGFGRYNLHFSPDIDDLKVGQEIRMFTDINGHEIYENGRWAITQYQPVIDVFYKLSGYRVKVALQQEEDDK